SFRLPFFTPDIGIAGCVDCATKARAGQAPLTITLAVYDTFTAQGGDKPLTITLAVHDTFTARAGASPAPTIVYCKTWVQMPAPTVRPPSRMANLTPSSIATGWINSTVISMLSPGITISTPSGSLIAPVTSVVLT